MKATDRHKARRDALTESPMEGDGSTEDIAMHGEDENIEINGMLDELAGTMADSLEGVDLPTPIPPQHDDDDQFNGMMDDTVQGMMDDAVIGSIADDLAKYLPMAEGAGTEILTDTLKNKEVANSPATAAQKAATDANTKAQLAAADALTETDANGPKHQLAASLALQAKAATAKAAVYGTAPGAAGAGMPGAKGGKSGGMSTGMKVVIGGGILAVVGGGLFFAMRKPAGGRGARR